MTTTFGHQVLTVNSSRAVAYPDRLVTEAFEEFQNSILFQFSPVQETATESETNFFSQPRASAYVPVLLADLFGVQDESLIKRATIAHLCFDYFSHTIDDLTDVPGQYRIQKMHVASLVFSHGVAILGAFPSINGAFWSHWQRYLTEASEAERLLWKHKGTLTSYSDSDFILLGKKSALINVSAALFASLTGNWQVLSEVERGLLSIAIAVQIMDDLLDWKEDLTNRVYTYPLCLAAERSGLLSEEHIQVGLTSEAVFNRILNCSREHLASGRSQFEVLNGGLMIGFVADLQLSIDRLFAAFKEAQKHPAEFDDFLTKRMRRTIDPRLSH
jgi:hypothetical protein